MTRVPVHRLLAIPALLLAGCGAGGQPVRSPLDDGGAAPTVPPGVTSYPPPLTPPPTDPG